MNEYEKLTFEKLPEALSILMHEVSIIKNHLLNTTANSKTAPEPSIQKDILSVNDIAAKLGITNGSVYNMTHSRQIPFYKKGGRIYFDAKEIDSWIRDDKRKTLKQLQDEVNIQEQ